MAETLLLSLLLAPILTGLACFLAPGARAAEWINILGAAVSLGIAAWVVKLIARDGADEAVRGVLYVDELSALLIGAIGLVSFAGALASVSFLRRELARNAVPQGEKGIRLYFAGLHALTATMYLTVTVDSLGLLWVGIEATTVASALLVGFYRGRAALEAAWKYVILCTVGITCALFGVMLTYFAARIGGGSVSLDWSSLSADPAQLDPDLMRLAFVFVLVGFGTKAGLAPLHTWMADAYSQAPAPISGVLSGALSACALFGVIRFHALTSAATGSDFSSHLLLVFGVLSLAVAAPFILLARDLKRLLAYSSLEHMGLMVIAFGIGGPLAITAGLLHIANHAATKPLLFIVAGRVRQRYGSRRIGAIRGMRTVEPVAAALLVAGIMAIVGLPPFGIFVSELGIVTAGIADGGWSTMVAIAAIVFLAIIFAGFTRHAIGMCTGTEPHDLSSAVRPDAAWTATLAVVPLLAVMVLFGVHVPQPIRDLLDQVVAIVEPASAEVARR